MLMSFKSSLYYLDKNHSSTRSFANIFCKSVIFSSVQSLSYVQLFATPWTAAHQASLSITNSQSLLKLKSSELVIPSSWNRLPQIETRTHMAGTQTLPKPSLGLETAKTHGTWFQDIMKLRFLMSHHRKNSVREKVIGKKWIYSDSERSTLHRQNVGQCRGRVGGPEMWLVSF